MTNSGNVFSDELTEWLLESGSIKSHCQMSIYYKYTPHGTNIIVLYYVDNCVYWCSYESLRKWFVENIGK